MRNKEKDLQHLGRPVVIALLTGLIFGFIMVIVIAGLQGDVSKNGASSPRWFWDALVVAVALTCAATAYLITRKQNKPLKGTVLRFKRFAILALVGSMIGAVFALIGGGFIGGILLFFPGAILCGFCGLRVYIGCPASAPILGHILPANAIAFGLLAGLLSLPFKIKKKRPKGHCRKCGYNLTGNVSGICPECGEPIVNQC